jgi:DNA-directed RNA polymerase subunit RPC12/RpoP
MTREVQLRSCTRCGGDMMLEQYLGDREFVCLQCGHRVSVDVPHVRQRVGAGRKKAA